MHINMIVKNVQYVLIMKHTCY